MLLIFVNIRYNTKLTGGFMNKYEKLIVYYLKNNSDSIYKLNQSKLINSIIKIINE